MVIRDLKPELHEKAKTEINEDPTQISDHLSNIQQWLTTQSHLKCRADEQWLLAFLRGCKYDLDKTKMKLDNFYSSRSLLPEYFENRDPLQPEIQSILNAGFFMPLPTPFEPNGPSIFYSNVPEVPDKKVNIVHLIKVYFMFLDVLLLENDNTTIGGTFTLIDCDEFPLRYLLQLTPAILKKFVYCIQDCYPVRIKKFYMVKAPLGVESIVNLMKSFMSKKLKKRFFVYGKKKSKKFTNVLPPQYLFKEKGGENSSRDEIIEYWKNKIESYRDWFIEDDQYHSIERFRTKKPRTLATVFGIADSFKDLNID